MALDRKEFRSPMEMQKLVDEYFGGLIEGEVPTVSGLCLSMKCTYNVLQQWGRMPEYDDIVAEAYMKIENWYEREISTRTTSTNGLQSVLENRFQWTKKREFELGEKTREAAAMKLPMSEKIAIMKKAHFELFAMQNKAVRLQEKAAKDAELYRVAREVSGTIVEEAEPDEQDQ